MRGDARNIMALLDDDVVTYASLFAALEDRYGARLSYTDVVEELSETKRAWIKICMTLQFKLNVFYVRPILMK